MGCENRDSLTLDPQNSFGPRHREPGSCKGCEWESRRDKKTVAPWPGKMSYRREELEAIHCEREAPARKSLTEAASGRRCDLLKRHNVRMASDDRSRLIGRGPNSRVNVPREELHLSSCASAPSSPAQPLRVRRLRSTGRVVTLGYWQRLPTWFGQSLGVWSCGVRNQAPCPPALQDAEAEYYSHGSNLRIWKVRQK